MTLPCRICKKEIPNIDGAFINLDLTTEVYLYTFEGPARLCALKSACFFCEKLERAEETAKRMVIEDLRSMYNDIPRKLIHDAEDKEPEP